MIKWRSLFAAIAPKYDRINATITLAARSSLASHRGERELALKPGDHTLDLCTGNRGLSLFVAPGRGRVRPSRRSRFLPANA